MKNKISKECKEFTQKIINDKSISGRLYINESLVKAENGDPIYELRINSDYIYSPIFNSTGFILKNINGYNYNYYSDIIINNRYIDNKILKRNITKDGSFLFGIFADTIEEVYLPFTEFEMKYIFDRLSKFCETNNLAIVKKKREEDKKSILMKLNLTEADLSILKEILSE